MAKIYSFALLYTIAAAAAAAHLLLSHSLSSATSFTILNNCSQTVWPAIIPDASSPALSTTGFSLLPGDSKTITASLSWGGRLWARTLCSEDSAGNFSCATGDCKSWKIECHSVSPRSPFTVAEFNLHGLDGKDYYYVNLVDGFNLPMIVVPQNGIGDCSTAGCSTDLNIVCPSELKLVGEDAGNGTATGCRSACEVFREARYCCTGAYVTPETCKPSSYTEFFRSACPRAYTYLFDDGTRTFNCSDSNYLITFCPAPAAELAAPSPTLPWGPGQGGDGQKKEQGKTSSGKQIGIFTASGVAFLVIVMALLCCVRSRRNRLRGDPMDWKGLVNEGNKDNDLKVLSFGSILAATESFAVGNKLGEGGFGPVYKGKLIDGREVAIKRLSGMSGQGEVEFRNELVLIAKLQHVNLVRLLGCCIHGDEKMLIYEYMPNKSLDSFLFDSALKGQLNWEKRFKIIEGITQGLLYLHKYSRLRIIHRDLKASNILLDENMNPKISDFGMAKIFKQDELQANTVRIVGTYGYMAPEYAMEGIFSMKSDIFSFGVLMLEIISGRKNNSFHDLDGPLNLVGYAWKLWNNNAIQELIDPVLSITSIQQQQLLRCIHVGLLCVEDQAIDRPSISEVISFLTDDSVALPSPKKPTFITASRDVEQGSCKRKENDSVNWFSMSQMVAR